MKTLIQSKLSIPVVVLTLFVISFCTNCKKADLKPETTVTTPVIPSGPQPLDLIGVKVDSGFCYKISYDFPVAGDSPTAPTLSTLHLFENGVELGPGHSVHADIRSYGLGQYSHWGNALYFSTSDNTNPLTNGRKYTYTVK